jgi:sortase A
MKKKLSTIILVVMIIAGFSLLLYPTVSDYWNSKRQTRAIASYQEAVAKLDDSEYQEILSEAQEYNDELAENDRDFVLSDEEMAEYNSKLDIAEDGLMSYIEIPSIDVYLPIYHGTDSNVLDVGVGHIPGSSLPVGGESTHCVLLAHRGLPSAKLFTNLDRLGVGDTFTLTTLNETLTYEVDQILITDPGDTSALGIEKGMDYCTLVTCTPYGINTHRLLVRGHRVKTEESLDIGYVSAEARQIQPVVVAPFAAIPIVIAMMILLHKGADDDDDDDDDDNYDDYDHYDHYGGIEKSYENDSIGKEDTGQ